MHRSRRSPQRAKLRPPQHITALPQRRPRTPQLGTDASAETVVVCDASAETVVVCDASAETVVRVMRLSKLGYGSLGSPWVCLGRCLVRVCSLCAAVSELHIPLMPLPALWNASGDSVRGRKCA